MMKVVHLTEEEANLLEQMLSDRIGAILTTQDDINECINEDLRRRPNRDVCDRYALLLSKSDKDFAQANDLKVKIRDAKILGGSL